MAIIKSNVLIELDYWKRKNGGKKGNAWKYSEKNISEVMNLQSASSEELVTIRKFGAMLAQQIPN